MLRNITKSLVLTCGILSLHGAEPNSALGMRVSTGCKPIIDGTVNSSEWSDAAKLPPFFKNVLLYSHVPGAQKSKATQEDALGLALIHGMHCFNIHALEIYGNYITTKPLLDFGVDAADSEWIPYWRNPLSQYPAGPVAVSGRKRGDRELAVIFNTAYAPAAFDFGGREAVDHLKKGGVLSGKLELSPRSLQIVEFGAK